MLLDLKELPLDRLMEAPKATGCELPPQHSGGKALILLELRVGLGQGERTLVPSHLPLLGLQAFADLPRYLRGGKGMGSSRSSCS